MNRRAYSLFTVKEADEETRIISGIATTPTPDRMGDIVEPKGAVFKLPLPLLWQHDSRKPVGQVIDAKVSEDGIAVRAQLARIEDPGALKDRIDEAWQSMKAGLVRGFSIGFQAIESARIEGTWSEHFLKWSWLELSLVTIPANAEATILAVKSADQIQRAAPGAQGRRPVCSVSQSTPAAARRSTPSTRRRPTSIARSS